MKVLHIGDNDLFSRRFNGYDWHDEFKKYGVELNELVVLKQSDSDFVYRVEHLNDTFTGSLIKNRLFLEADLIHLDLIHNTPFDLNYLPIISRLKPTVITLHDPFFLGGHCIHHFNCQKWKNHCYDCQYLDVPFNIKADDTALKFEMKKLAIQNSNIQAIAGSDWLKNKLMQSPIWREKIIYKFPFGINQNIFTPFDSCEAKRKLGIESDSIVLMLRAANNPYKGLDIILESMKRIKSEKKITIITVQDKNLLNDLNSFFDIREYGWVNDDLLLAQLYQACDLFLMPSKQETFGLMAVEAMSCGKMVLSTKGTAIEHVINSPVCGIAVEHKFESYADQLQILINNLDEVKRRGEKSLDFAKEHYDQTEYIKKTIKIYEENIKKHFDCFGSDSGIKLTINQLLKYNQDYQKEIVPVHSNRRKKRIREIMIRLLCAFIPSSLTRKKIRAKYL
jgi:glycosyltransferase involved in cell wall biosynthesis